MEFEHEFFGFWAGLLHAYKMLPMKNVGSFLICLNHQQNIFRLRKEKVFCLVSQHLCHLVWATDVHGYQ